MRIRERILINFVSAVTILAAISLSAVYFLFSAYREEEFQQRQKAKIILTINLFSQYKAESESLSKSMDQLSINDFFDEKLMVFNGKKELLFSSIDDLSIQNFDSLLNILSPETVWVETKEGEYDLIGMYYERDNQSYYAISKAYDEYGISKLDFLKNTLGLIFLGILVTVIIISFFISKKLALPITKLSEDLKSFDFYAEKSKSIRKGNSGSHEIDQLYSRFNDLLKRTDESMAFQKHAVQHISHELKTPIAIMVSELERIQKEIDDLTLSDQMGQLSMKAKSLGEIIQSLLQISKVESGQNIESQEVRIDELIFDLIEDLGSISPEFRIDFELQYDGDLQEEKLLVTANYVLLKQAFQNLLSNAISYSNNHTAQIRILFDTEQVVKIRISNPGRILDEREQSLLFHHFFRGENSKGKIGFGLGLVLTKKILTLFGGSIRYESQTLDQNVFLIQLPLR